MDAEAHFQNASTFVRVARLCPVGSRLRGEAIAAARADYDTAVRLTLAHMAGLKACGEGVVWYGNPHEAGSPEAYAWDQGHTAKRKPWDGRSSTLRNEQHLGRYRK